MIQQPLHLLTLIIAITALGFWLEHRFRWAAKVSGTLLMIAFGALISNLEWVPLQSPVYDIVYGPVTSLAIVWLLLAVDLRDLKRAGPVMLVTFGVAVLGTALGAIAAFLLFGGSFGGNAWKLAGVMTGTYSGGSLNFAAVGRDLDLPNHLYTAATAADNVVTALWFGITLLAPAWLGRHFKGGAWTVHKAATKHADSHPVHGAVQVSALDWCFLLVIGLAVLVLAEWAGGYFPSVPGALWLTTLAILSGLTPFVRRLRGAMQLGSIALHIFFVVIGIGSKIGEIVKVGPAIFYFTITVVLIHGLVLFLFAKLRKRDWDTTAIASQAAIGGPSTAMALALARNRSDLVLPGVAVGLLGYVVGNYAGFAVAYLLR